jgi:uncharacterized protein (UPF0305 family)
MPQQSDRLVTFVFSHQTLVIEGIFATILGIIVIWLFSNLGEESERNSPADQEEIKKMLKKVLAEKNANAAIAAAPVAPPKLATPLPGAVPTPVVTKPVITPLTPSAPKIESLEAKPVAAAAVEAIPLMAQVANPAPIVVTTTVSDAADALKLKNEIDNRNKKVDELEKALLQSKEDLARMQDTSKNTEALEEMRKQIAKLEGRLKEYAIIEDDIANLSAYKDENDKLKTEIALLKKKGSRPEAEEILGRAGIPPAEITAAPLSAVPKAGDAQPSWPINEGESKKLLNEFDSLMNTQVQTAANETMDQSAASDGEKLIAEFQNFMKGTPG